MSDHVAHRRAGIRRLVVQLAFSVALVALVAGGAFVRWILRWAVVPVAFAIVPLYFAVEDPDRRGFFLRVAAGSAAAGVVVSLLP